MKSQTSYRRPLSPAALRRAALLSGLALTGTLASSLLLGCEESASTTAIRKATGDAHIAANKSTTAEELATNLRTSAEAARQATSAGTKAEQAAAAVLESGAALASGEDFAQRAALADQDVRRQLTQLSALASAWSRQNALAQAAQAFDPSSQIRELQSQIDDLSSQIGSRRSTASELGTRLASLESQLKAKRDEASGLASQAGSLAQQASKLSAREGVSLVEQSTTLARQADALRKQADLLQLQVEELRPQLTEATALAEQAQNQSARFAQLQQGLRDRQAASRQDAAAARDQAEKVRTELSSALTSLNTARDTFSSAYDKAGQAFKAAASAAGKASQDNAQSAKVASGNAQLSLAGLQLMRVQQLDSLATGFAMLVDTQPALPDATALQGQLDEFVQQSKATREEAKATLESAKGQFAGVQGPARERFEKLTASFENLTKAPAPRIGASSPDALLRAAISASKEGRWDDLRALYTPASTPEGKELIEMGIRQSELGKAANDAVQEKFGKSLVDLLKGNPETEQAAMMMSMMSGGDLSMLDPAGASINDRGNGKATITLPGSPLPLSAVKDGAGWKFDGTQMDSLAPMMSAAKPIVDKLLTGMQTFTQQVQAGDFADEAAAAKAFAALMPSM
jgi:hypothetical protein